MKNSDKSSFLSSFRFVFWQCFAAAVLVVVLLFVLRYWMNKHTEHGIEVEVPQVTGLNTEEARMLLKGNRLGLLVVDSTYSNKVPLGTIVEQTPRAESMAKTGRVVYVVVNAKQRRQVIVPDLADISYRQAENMLRQQGLRVDSLEYEPSAYRDLVLDVRRNGESVPPGTRLTEGESVVLVVGMGLGEGKTTVPNLTGRTILEARSLLLANRLTVGTVSLEGDTVQQPDMVVYRQTPLEGEQLQEGQSVNIWLTNDLERAAKENNTQAEEDFF